MCDLQWRGRSLAFSRLREKAHTTCGRSGLSELSAPVSLTLGRPTLTNGSAVQLMTPRLKFRPWQARDRPVFGRMNADADVRRYYYPSILTRAESDLVVEECTKHLDDHGFAFLAVERRQDQVLIGGAGLSWTEECPGGPAIEIGWILDRQFWRQGYAREASLAWFAQGWTIGLDQIVGYTSAINLPSRRLMSSLGMPCNPADDFLDPTVPKTNPLSPHVLYRIWKPRGRSGLADVKRA